MLVDRNHTGSSNVPRKVCQPVSGSNGVPHNAIGRAAGRKKEVTNADAAGNVSTIPTQRIHLNGFLFAFFMLQSAYTATSYVFLNSASSRSCSALSAMNQLAPIRDEANAITRMEPSHR